MNPNSAVDAYGRCQIVDQPDCHRSGYYVPTAKATKTSELLADPAQVAAIRELYAHARHVRADHHIYPGGNSASGATWPAEHTWTVGTSRVLIHDGWLVYLSHGAPLLKVTVDNARQVGQLLAAIGVLPQRFIGGAK